MRKLLFISLAVCAAAAATFAQGGATQKVADPVVVQFIVDGIDHNSVRTAIGAGAKTLESLLAQGVTVDTYYCTSPAPRLDLPDGSRPWGGSTSSNVAMHTGTHLFESYNIDDIFLSAKRAGLVSMFAGGSNNYAIFKNATHLYYGGNELTDAMVVDHGLRHLRNDKARLLRLHLQHIRNAWRGPGDTTNPKSEYIQYFVKTVDAELARFIAGLKQAGVWDRTYIIFGSDHGMGQTSQSGHPQSVLSSWSTFMAFYGPGVKRGAHIPYAEGPDVAVMTNYFLGLPPLRGHLDANVPKNLGRVTGVLLENALEGGPADVRHPRYIEQYLKSDMPRGDTYTDYRAAMVKLLSAAQQPAQQPAPQPTPDTDLTRLGYVSSADIAAGLKKLPHDRADVAFRIFQVPPYNVNAAHRAPVTQVANVHDDQSELFMVLNGSGSIVWGGKVSGATRNGANVTGPSIEGGTTQKLAKGDFFLVPPGLPHMFADIAPGGLELMQVYLPKGR